MKWKILSDGKGVIIERGAIGVEKNTEFSFDGIGEGYTAIFKREDGRRAYGSISDGVCSVGEDFLKKGNTFLVAVSTFTGDEPIICEGIKRVVCEGKSFVVPDDGNLPSEVARLRTENDDIRARMAEMNKKFEELLARVGELEGFDI